MTNFKIGLGSNLKIARKIKGITQEELAEIIGLHPRQLSKIETGEHFPSCKTLERIVAALDIDPKVLFDFEFLTDVHEITTVKTGTDNAVHFQAHKTSQNNVYELRTSEENKEFTPENCSDKSMAKAAKTLNKPLFVEYFQNKKTTKIVVFYPDGREKVIKNTQDVETKQNINYIMGKLKKIAKDKASMNYAKLALDALDDDTSLKKLEGVIYGMKLTRGID